MTEEQEGQDKRESPLSVNERRLRLHSSIRWRSAWLSCTCGPPRAHSKSKSVEL
ncbi:hypothetical protein PAMP_001383 [Pampus punctatissimus]